MGYKSGQPEAVRLYCHLMDLVVGASIALVAALLGYQVRRWEHRREQRLEAYRSVFGAFHEAARAGADLLSVHTQVGFPADLSSGQLSDEDRQRMANAHSQAWAEAASARHEFDVAAFGVELVGSQQAMHVAEDLRSFLEESLYSGVPWNRQGSYPRAGINPVDIIPASIDRARPHVQLLSRELWHTRFRRR